MRPFELTWTDNKIKLAFNWGKVDCFISALDYGIRVETTTGTPSEFRFYEFSKILTYALENCLKNYTPRRKGKFLRVPDGNWENFIYRYRKSMVKRQYKLICKTFKSLWEKLLESANTDAVRLDRALQHARGPKADIETFNILWPKARLNKWILEDCTKYIPALLFHYNYSDYKNINAWRDYYARGKAYKALNQTLDAINYPLPFDVLQSIRQVKFERPVTTRLELLQILRAADRPRVLPFLFKSNYKEIKTVIKKLSPTVDLRSTRQGLDTYSLDDYLRHETYNGTLTGLIKRTHEWHERLARDRERERLIRRATQEKEQAELMDKDNAQPEFDIAELDENIRFLEKVRDLHNESDVMNHCVSTYSDYTLNGDSFIFHVDYMGEMATIELDSDYKVSQARGIRNAKNTATQWAEKYFYNFVKKWREKNELITV